MMWYCWQRQVVFIAEYVPVLMNVIMAFLLGLGIVLTLMGLPGNSFILILAFLYGWQEDFSRLTYLTLASLAGLWLVGELLEFFAGVAGAKRENASWWGAFAAFAGMIAGGILGTFVMPVIGTIIGALLAGAAAAYYLEYMQTNDKTKARRVAWGVVKGQLIGMLAKFVIAIGMSAAIIYKLWF